VAQQKIINCTQGWSEPPNFEKKKDKRKEKKFSWRRRNQGETIFSLVDDSVVKNENVYFGNEQKKVRLFFF